MNLTNLRSFPNSTDVPPADERLGIQSPLLVWRNFPFPSASGVFWQSGNHEPVPMVIAETRDRSGKPLQFAICVRQLLE
ncbi:MAG: hypothetical protein JWM11_6739 [Planctomycetaceae bacterium]|nr:hypothetical protein [Planctomycetaceae bacterium]